MNVNKTILRTATLVALGLSAITMAHAHQDPYSPWLVRARAVELNWANKQNNGLDATNVTATNKAIPEVDVSYFFTKNIAAELVLTYPQKVNVTVAGNPGTLKALPPSLLVQYHFTDLGAIKPYVGVGMNYTSFTSVSVPAIPTASLSSNSTGGVAQIGVDYMIDKNWGLNFDLKYIQIKTEVYAGGADKGQLALNPTAAALGVTYRY